MKKFLFFTLFFNLVLNLFAQTTVDKYFGENENSLKDEYILLRENISKKFENQTPKEWKESVSGVKTKLDTNKKIIALTMDACGGTKEADYDEKLISFLEQEKIPATLFINARWIDKNLSIFKTLASNSLFEIANHGLEHNPASVNGKSIYKIKGTKNITELVDEIELNAKKIEKITGKRPKYFRSGTAYYDEIAVKIANELKHEVIGFSILGDAGATYTKEQVEKAFLSSKKGEIIIIHMNHPQSQTADGTIKAIKELRQKGFEFVKLSDYDLK